MARNKSRWTRRLDPKRAGFAALLRLTRDRPALRRALSFYPLIDDLPAGRIEHVAADEAYRIRLAEPGWADAVAAVAEHDWDVRRPEAIRQDDWTSRIFVGIVRDVVVPGHTLVPVDPNTALAATFGLRGLTNWNFARPAVRLRTERIAEPALVLPPFPNYWHLLLEHLLPLIEAWRLRAWSDEPLAVVTRTERPALVDTVLDGLRAEGATIRVVTPGPATTLRLDRMLVATNLCSNAEHSYALARAIPTARRILAAGWRDRPAARSWPARLYVTRGNARLRRIANESVLVEGLAARGFAVFEARWDNGPDQVAAFSEAEIVVGPHGAGLTNLVWARPGTALVELFPFDHRKTPMMHLCAEHGLGHHALFGSPEGRDQAFTVDPEALFRIVDGL